MFSSGCIAQDIQTDASDWLLINATCDACWYSCHQTGTISTVLMWYLLMGPGSASVILIVVFLKCNNPLLAFQQHSEIFGRGHCSSKDCRGLISKYQISQACTDGPSLVPVCQYAAALTIIRSWSRAPQVLSDTHLLVNVCGPYRQWYSVQFSWAPPWSWILRETCPPYLGGHGLLQ